MEQKRPTVLIVDDEPALREVLSLRIEAWGYGIVAVGDATEAERAVIAGRADVLVTDVVLPDHSGIDLLKRVRKYRPSLPVIVITAHAHIDAAVDAMKAGATDFLTKPLDYTTLRTLLDATAGDLRQYDATRALDARLGEVGLPGLVVGDSPRMREVEHLVTLVASADAPALITGESGTGKELIARAIHTCSARHNKPFVAINAAAIPDGLIESEIFGHEQGAFTGATRARPGCFELANGGTLFLDEIAEMPIRLQPKLLRILEDGRGRRVGGTREMSFDVRVIGATNRSVPAAVRDGLLREDLVYRLNVFEIALPPLRERREDLALLAHHCVRELGRKHDMPVEGVTESALAQMRLHSWPGNVRELRNVIERAIIVARKGWIDVTHLPPYLRTLRSEAAAIVLPPDATMADAERILILETLKRVGQNKMEAARRLGIDVKTIRNKLRITIPRPPA